MTISVFHPLPLSRGAMAQSVGQQGLEVAGEEGAMVAEGEEGAMVAEGEEGAMVMDGEGVAMDVGEWGEEVEMEDEEEMVGEGDEEEFETDATASSDSLPTIPDSPLFDHRRLRRRQEELREATERGLAAPVWVTPPVIALPDYDRSS